MIVNNDKRRVREAPSFANINLLGKCNARCFFCLGADIPNELAPFNQTKVHFSEWANFSEFLDLCRSKGITKLYVTGQNTDSLLYVFLGELIDWLHAQGFQVGLRTNGYLALDNMERINRCDLSVGYSIHSLIPEVNRMILGRADIPDWQRILTETKRPRVQIVVNRCNTHEVFPIVRFAAMFPNVRYIQVRRVSTDTRLELLAPDIAAYEQVYSTARECFALKGRLWEDAEVYEIGGKDVVFWRTVKTSISSLNYFTDGTVSDEYFIVEGYLKNR